MNDRFLEKRLQLYNRYLVRKLQGFYWRDGFWGKRSFRKLYPVGNKNKGTHCRTINFIHIEKYWESRSK
ncbi:MAG: hypothetical protein AABY32_01590 [Nanoarchaeota archaeon]